MVQNWLCLWLQQNVVTSQTKGTLKNKQFWTWTVHEFFVIKWTYRRQPYAVQIIYCVTIPDMDMVLNILHQWFEDKELLCLFFVGAVKEMCCANKQIKHLKPNIQDTNTEKWKTVLQNNILQNCGSFLIYYIFKIKLLNFPPYRI